MPLTHVAQRVGFNIQTLRRILEEEGLYIRSPPTPLWTEEEVRVLPRDYGKPGFSVSNIAAKLGRTANQVILKARLLGLKWPLRGSWQYLRRKRPSVPECTLKSRAIDRADSPAASRLRASAFWRSVRPGSVPRLARNSSPDARLPAPRCTGRAIQIPIAPADRRAPIPRFLSLAAFERRPSGLGARGKLSQRAGILYLAGAV